MLSLFEHRRSALAFATKCGRDWLKQKETFVVKFDLRENSAADQMESVSRADELLKVHAHVLLALTDFGLFPRHGSMQWFCH